MRALLDTHILLWFIAGDERLPLTWREALEAREDEFFISAASAAEISIKFVKGKLKLPEPPVKLIPEVLSDLKLLTLPVTLQHALTVSTLALHHSDPFDRLLIAQSKVESIPVVTGDPLMSLYPIQILW